MPKPMAIRYCRREAKLIMNLCGGLRPCRAAVEAGYCASSAKNVLRKQHVAIAIRSMHESLGRVVTKLDRWAA
jgi:hypothetical protein